MTETWLRFRSDLVSQVIARRPSPEQERFSMAVTILRAADSDRAALGAVPRGPRVMLSASRDSSLACL